VAGSEGSQHSSRPLRVLQIGLGAWGQSWADVVRDVPEVEAAGWVDANPAALETAPPGVRTFADLPSAIGVEPAPDAVLVTTGVHAHAPVAKAALEAGLHVLVEKPFAPTLREAEALVDLAAARGRTLMVSQNYRFHGAPVAVADLLRREQIGAIGNVRVDFRKRFRHPADHPYRRGFQPLLLDMFVHHADLMRFVLARQAVAVECTTWNPPWSRFEDPASAAMTVDFGDDLTVTWRGSWESTSAPTLWAGEWTIEGADGSVAWSSRGDLEEEDVDWVRLRRDGEIRELPVNAPRAIDRRGSLTAFAAAIHAGTVPETSGRDNLGTLEICFAAIRSAAEGRRVSVASLD